MNKEAERFLKRGKFLSNFGGVLYGERQLLNFIKESMYYSHTIGSVSYDIEIFKHDELDFTAQIIGEQISLCYNNVRFYSDKFLSESTKEEDVEEYRKLFLRFYDSHNLAKELPINKTKRKVEKI